MRTLYLFASSLRPDAYINSLAHTVETMSVSRVFIVTIREGYDNNLGAKEPEGKKNESEVLASTVFGRIEEQLRALCEGKYIENRKDGSQRIARLLNTEGISTYERCLAVMNHSATLKAIPLVDLDQILRSFTREKNCIVDVTAVKKNLLVDIIAVLLSLSFSDVYNFELIKPQEFDQLDLWHNMRYSKDFVYNNLAASKAVQNGLMRISRWSMRVQSVMLVSAILAGGFVALSLLRPESKALTLFNISAMVASVGSYIFLLVRRPDN
jgi:hypothetical protein